MNPLLRDNPVYSFLRHWVTGGLLILANRFGVTNDYLDPAVSWIGDLVVLLAGWLLVKFVLPWLSKVGFLQFLKSQKEGRLPLFFMMCVMVLSLGLMSCSGGQFSPQVSGYYRHESGAKAGIGSDGHAFFRLPNFSKYDDTGEGSIEVIFAK